MSVIQLYKENRSTRKIAKLVHMSFRDIGAVILFMSSFAISIVSSVSLLHGRENERLE